MSLTLKQSLISFLLSFVVVSAIFVVFENSRAIKNRPVIEEVTVVIPEGKNIVEIDAILHSTEVLDDNSSLLDIEQPLEGYLFPDTYRFYKHSSTDAVITRFLENFRSKAQPLLMQDPKNFQRNLTMASLIEKEVPDFEERKIVAGLLFKRLNVGMPLQVDATLCYSKLHTELAKITSSKSADPNLALTDNLTQLSFDSLSNNCYPITDKDKWIDSPYNTYLKTGLPPRPISNPGLSAIKAVLEAENSPYWFYLSDPATDKTIFSRNLEEHNQSKRRYLD